MRGLVRLMLTAALVLALITAAAWWVRSRTAPEAPPGEAAGPQRAVVTWISDGDTLRVEVDGHSLGRVRILGIDAPEVERDDHRGECYAAQASELLAELAPVGSEVTLIPDPTQPNLDRFDRALRYVERDGVDVSEELLAQGAARIYTSRPPVERHERYEEARDRARDAGAGLWSVCD